MNLGLIMAAERPAVADSERCGWKWAARKLSPLRETPMSSIDAMAAAADDCIDVEERPRSMNPKLGVLPSSIRSFLCCSRSRSFACTPTIAVRTKMQPLHDVIECMVLSLLVLQGCSIKWSPHTSTECERQMPSYLAVTSVIVRALD